MDLKDIKIGENYIIKWIRDYSVSKVIDKDISDCKIQTDNNRTDMVPPHRIICHVSEYYDDCTNIGITSFIKDKYPEYEY